MFMSFSFASNNKKKSFFSLFFLTGTNNLDHEEDKKKTASNHLSELRLILLGWRWPGKSLTGNTILGYEEFRLERAAEFSVKRDAERLGRKLTVVDTPGWFSAQTTPAAYQQEMTRSLSMCPPGPHAFLLVVPVGMFTDTDRTRIEENLVLFGEAVWRHTIVVFTWAEVLKNMPIERHIRRQGSALQWVLDKCKKRYHVINNDAFGEHTQVPQLIEKLEKMVAEEGGYFKPMTEEERAKIQVTVAATDENSNPNEVKEKRELGARPKQNCSFSSVQSVDAESPHSKFNAFYFGTWADPFYKRPHPSSVISGLYVSQTQYIINISNNDLTSNVATPTHISLLL